MRHFVSRLCTSLWRTWLGVGVGRVRYHDPKPRPTPSPDPDRDPNPGRACDAQRAAPTTGMARSPASHRAPSAARYRVRA
eukprot:scaffold21562_cov63-Phaeocystis_antarctica.AAC.3